MWALNGIWYNLCKLPTKAEKNGEMLEFKKSPMEEFDSGGRLRLITMN